MLNPPDRTHIDPGEIGNLASDGDLEESFKDMKEAVKDFKQEVAERKARETAAIAAAGAATISDV